MKITKLLFALLLAITVSSCSQKPSNVAESFLNDISNNKFEDAKKLSTPEAQSLIDNIMKEGSANPESSKWTYKITKEETKGDISTVYFTNIPTGKPEMKQSVRLVKNDGHWLVSKLALEQ